MSTSDGFSFTVAKPCDTFTLGREHNGCGAATVSRWQTLHKRTGADCLRGLFRRRVAHCAIFTKPHRPALSEPVQDRHKLHPVPKRLELPIYEHLTAAGIEIPNPQRDLHIRSGILKVENITKNESED